MIITRSTKDIDLPIQPINFNWSSNSSIKNLLDIISFIFAEEYIQIAKNNPEIFLNQGEQK